mmetsp:Transcript_11479/g.25269  ORF Transcript_11479/g.25269 Transcript_11479/m.25269 type:complete len:200 (+) Transcript_11479:283-882(+)|eukprot:CAMPEP_0206477678 /NCGR_PEP_ID=MMETSP0324_2-20121206/35557_1 /ASSEMBLY_ACC=CAM_ASM_000836 /TAXON_ID=2866 /ORGANISM="Crypthecodinium cohnii, Strain Seligo" /LENGTH=199 /DNA_ID=CAMNT_0053953751 /DNA_START=208 /DNA_END=807 /DNA_ORIENTATION=-
MESEARSHPGRQPLLFFGLPGSGKSHCAKLAEEELGYEFHEGDHWLPEDLKANLARGQGFDDEQRLRFANEVADKMASARSHPEARPLAVSQAVFQRRCRDAIRAKHPDVVFVWVRADTPSRQARLAKGGNLVDKALGQKMKNDFEEPAEDELHVLLTLDNHRVDHSTEIAHHELRNQLRQVAHAASRLHARQHAAMQN